MTPQFIAAALDELRAEYGKKYQRRKETPRWSLHEQKLELMHYAGRMAILQEAARLIRNQGGSEPWSQ